MKSFIPWVGGKSKLLWLIHKLSPSRYSRFIDVFGGSGTVTLSRPIQQGCMEVYNDFNGDLTNLFCCVKNRTMALLLELGFLPLNTRDDFNVLYKFFSREEFTDDYLDEEMELTQRYLEPPDAKTIRRMMLERAPRGDVRRASDYFKLIRYSFSGGAKSFAGKSCDIRRFFHLVWECSRRLAEVVIENKDCVDLIRQYDREDAFFYASKYALSERLVCGECGTLYRRCTWSKGGKKRVVWRCVSRLDYGTKYCHNSPTLDEEPLQRSILAAINSVMSQKSTLIRQITSAMEVELAPVPGESISLAAIEQRLDELNNLTRELVAEAARTKDAEAYTAQLREIMNEAAELKEKRAYIEEQRQNNTQAVQRIEDAAAAMEQASCHICEWDEALIRQLVDTVKVHSAEKITVYLRGGVQVDQDMI